MQVVLLIHSRFLLALLGPLLLSDLVDVYLALVDDVLESR